MFLLTFFSLSRYLFICLLFFLFRRSVSFNDSLFKFVHFSLNQPIFFDFLVFKKDADFGVFLICLQGKLSNLILYKKRIPFSLFFFEQKSLFLFPFLLFQAENDTALQNIFGISTIYYYIHSLQINKMNIMISFMYQVIRLINIVDIMFRFWIKYYIKH